MAAMQERLKFMREEEERILVINLIEKCCDKFCSKKFNIKINIKIIFVIMLNMLIMLNKKYFVLERRR